jgi:hypothetical protein
LSSLPVELLVAWVVWLGGGLALMLWFRRASAPPPSPPRSTSSSGVRPASDVRPAARPPAKRAPDAFGELQELLDPPSSEHKEAERQ